MDTATLVLAYAAAAAVAAVVTVAFSAPIERVLFRLLPEEVAPAWNQFVKFALFVASFAGGLPAPISGFVDRAAPPIEPAEGEGLMIVMNSVGGALMAAAWVLLAFFAVTLTALTAGRVYASYRKRRELAARALAQREEERKLEKARQDRSEGAPLKRQEPAEPRPVKPQEKPAPQPPRPR